jgi:hypothetical protein
MFTNCNPPPPLVAFPATGQMAVLQLQTTGWNYQTNYVGSNCRGAINEKSNTKLYFSLDIQCHTPLF